GVAEKARANRAARRGRGPSRPCVVGDIGTAVIADKSVVAQMRNPHLAGQVDRMVMPARLTFLDDEPAVDRRDLVDASHLGRGRDRNDHDVALKRLAAPRIEVPNSHLSRSSSGSAGMETSAAATLPGIMPARSRPWSLTPPTIWCALPRAGS